MQAARSSFTRTPYTALAARSRRLEHPDVRTSGDLEPPPEVVADLHGLCDEGRFGTALARVEAFGPFESWRTTPASCAAVRLVGHLGGRARARRLALASFRRDARHPLARFWVHSTCLDARGPLGAFAFLEAESPDERASTEDRQHYAWSRAVNAMAFRDFESAEQWLAVAEELTPDDPYGTTLRVSWLSAQDRYDEALELARTNFGQHPRHRASVEALADMLELRAEFEAAHELLRTSAPAEECGAFHLALARIERELGRHADVLVSVERAEKLLPLLETDGQRHLAGLRSDARYFGDDLEGAIAEAKRAGPGFFQDLAERLEARREGKRTILDVGFVRQHHMTCVPATLSTLGNFWERRVDHLELVERICYDGTPAHSERKWAKENGWVTREFSTDYATASALVDRKIPFVITTVQAISAHAQAVIGYDQRRGTLFLRDPYLPGTVEAVAEPFLQRYRAHGPRGFALVPADRSDAFDGIEFPDRALYEINEDLEAALDAHDRPRALARAAELNERAPKHHLAYLARRAIAAYDSNPHELERVADEALVTFPDEPTWLITHLNALRQTATFARVRQALEVIHARDVVHPVFGEMLAAELLQDSREIPRAERILRRVAAAMPERSQVVGLLARAAWRRRDFVRALTLHRLAACLDPMNETWAEAYFEAARAQGSKEQALDFLRARFERFAKRSARPAITLFAALESVDLAAEGFELLERAQAVRPDDGELACFCAEAHARYGKFELARDGLEHAKPRTPPHAWRESAAYVAWLSGEHERAIELGREIVRDEPFSVRAHAALCERLAAVHGPASARAHMLEVTSRFPNNAALLRLAAEWHGDEAPARVEVLVRRLLELEPSDAWARRELALVLSRTGRVGEAREESRLALEVAPDHVSSHLVDARVREVGADLVGARSAYVRAVEIYPDSDLAIVRALALTTGRADAEELLAHVYSEVARGSLDGRGVLAWYDEARRRLEPARLALELDELRQRRPDLPAVWQCAAWHARACGDVRASVELARAASERFPLMSGTWLELARAHRADENLEAARAAVEKALDVAPGDVGAARLYADLLSRSGADDHGASALERALRLSPLEPALLLAHADVLWRSGRRDEAVSEVRRALEADPGEARAWDRLAAWGETGEFDPRSLVRQLAERRPWDTRIFLRLAEFQSRDDVRSALETLAHVLEIDPSCIEAYDASAVYAAELGHRGAALARCRPAHFGANVPALLRGREAWVHARFGDLGAAIAKMKAVVAEQPEYEWGFQQLADWAEHTKDTATALEAARALVRLSPSAAPAHGYLADALVAAGRPKEARKAFRTALALDPGYRFGLHRLVEAWLEAQQPVKARRVLARSRAHVATYDVEYLSFRIAMLEKDWREAERALQALLLDPDAPPSLVQNAASMATDVDWYFAKRMLARALDEPDAPESVGRAWATHRLRGNEVPGVATFWRLIRRNPRAAGRALATTFDYLGERQSWIGVLWLVCFNPRFTRAEIELWGSVGYALANANANLLCALWLASYDSRRPSAWMLLNLATSLRGLGLWSMARGVSHDALKLPRDSSFSAHSALLALDASLSDRLDEAALLVADAGGADTSQYYQNVIELVESCIAIEKAPAEERSLAVEQAFRALDRLHPHPILGLFGLEGIGWRRVSRRIARVSGRGFDYVHGYATSVAALGVAALSVYAIVVTDGVALAWYAGARMFWFAIRRLSRAV